MYFHKLSNSLAWSSQYFLFIHLLCRICEAISSFILDIVISFFFIYLASGFSLLLIFSNNQILISLIYSTDFIFYAIALSFIITSFVFGLGLILSFFTFLKMKA